MASFVGRDSELEALLLAVERACSGESGSLTIVEGEAWMARPGCAKGWKRLPGAPGLGLGLFGAFPGGQRRTCLLAVNVTDQFGNVVTDPDVSWSAVVEAGSIDPSGIFAAGIVPGLCEQALTVLVRVNGTILEQKFDMVVGSGLNAA